ncbi:B3 domain-containing protein [Heracleum sosnowskyi]|uniref:B3 domain-containing protein n=1 Tax=Heracleum sosnowskyi TaxID=360622 RepID=A0AAD8NAB8_9APIA|nr:B3 domain-containing protein [Heracleum sosnowskyi]
MDKNVAAVEMLPSSSDSRNQMLPSGSDSGNKQFDVGIEKETQVLDKQNVDTLVRKAPLPVASEFQPSSKIRKVSETNEKTTNLEVVSFDLDKSTESYQPNVETTSARLKFDSKVSPAMDRALKIQANLPSKSPSFVKTVILSHVASGFTMHLPTKFSNLHLPKHDEAVVILVDESEQEYKTKYLARRGGISGGWRRFSVDHELKEKDVLVFHLIQGCKFKVYIVRANASTDGAEEMVALSNSVVPAADHYGMDTNDVGSEDFDCIRFCESVVDFKDVKSFESFNIIVEGITIDSEFPQPLRVKYYELCCSQKSYLHDQLIEGLNLQLVIGFISETINIADAIISSKYPTCCKNLKLWDKTLKSFEDLGMRVGFLRARINKLQILSSDSEEALKFKRLEKVKAEEELKALEIKRGSVKEAIVKLDYEIEALEMKGERLEAVFIEEAKAPW